MKVKSLGIWIISLLAVSTAWAQSTEPSTVPPEEVIGSGTPRFLARFTGPHRIGDSKVFQAPNGSIGIGTTTPVWPLHVFSTKKLGSGGYPPIAIWAESTAPNTWGGVFAVASSPTGNTIALNGEAYSHNGIGVIGQGGGNDVVGATATTDAFAVGTLGDSQGTTGPRGGDIRASLESPRNRGSVHQPTGGNILVGSVSQNPDVTVFRVDGNGTVFANGGFQPSGADFAEAMAATGDRSKHAAGDLLVIDPATARHVDLAQQPYSTLVAGIYSTKPGMLGSTRKVDDVPAKDEVPLAVVGIVPCKITSENGPIQVGDLLVASSTPGHAMKGTDRGKLIGAVVGKALEPMQEGKGVIQVLVTLQ
jgi:hypothetical protein